MKTHNNVVDLLESINGQEMSLSLAKAVIKTQFTRIDYLIDKLSRYESGYSFAEMIREMEDQSDD